MMENALSLSHQHKKKENQEEEGDDKEMGMDAILE